MILIDIMMMKWRDYDRHLIANLVLLRMFPFLVTVTTTGQHKRSTTKVLQVEFISDQKSQHAAMLKSENTVFPPRLRKLHGAINIGMGCQSSSNGTCFVQALHYKVVLGSTLCNFVVQSTTEKYFLQALLYKVVLGNTFCKLCSTQYYWEVACASFVVQSSTGKCFVQAL